VAVINDLVAAEPVGVKTKFLLNVYTQEGKEGHQIFDNSKDEEVDVIEPMLFVDYKIDEKTNVNAHFIFDAWSAASDTKLDGNTGASGKGIGNQSRIAGNIGMSRDHKSYKWSSRLGVSSEYDYQSLNFGGTLETHHAEDNFVFAISPQLFLDQSKSFDYRRQETTEFKGRVISSLDISGSQILTTHDVLQAGVALIHMNGSLDNISNSVVVRTNPYGNAFSRVEERLPHQRFRQALYSKWIHAFKEDLAAHLSYRYYQDDWDLKGHTAEVGLRQALNDEEDFLMLTYRYYDQDQVEYYGQEFSTERPEMTSDSDLSAFESHRYGIHYSKLLDDKNFKSLSFTNTNFSSGLYYYQRSNDLYYVILQLALSTEF
jgi:hypothetical protein